MVSTGVVKVIFARLLVAPESAAIVLAMVVKPFKDTVPVPVLKVPVPVWTKLPEAILIPVAPVIAPPEEMSRFVVSKAKVPEPPPILTRVLAVPVLIEVVELVLLLILVVPVMVNPPVPCNKPEPEFTPTNTAAPVLVIFQVLAVPEISLPVPELLIARTSPVAEALD